jgi:hypothetical protein
MEIASSGAAHPLRNDYPPQLRRVPRTLLAMTTLPSLGGRCAPSCDDYPSPASVRLRMCGPPPHPSQGSPARPKCP